jgi:hypothetical protein
VLNTPQELMKTEAKLRSKETTESKLVNRKQIKISLVEGMVYDETGRDMTTDNKGSAKFIELNFRKRPFNELQEKKELNYDESIPTFKNKNYGCEYSEDQSESDYVAKFIEQAAIISGINPNQKSYQEPSPMRKRIAEINKFNGMLK